jgi:ADP-ribose pyrophosphatase YjhB (NUDIX family)
LRLVPYPDIAFCRLCGSPSDRRVPPGEDRERSVCRACGYVDYVNPTNVVGTVPTWGPDGDHVLLCLRAIEPRKGFWTLPAGFLEYGETLADGAARETREEAGAQIELDGLFTVLDVVQAGQVHVFYRARMLRPDLDPGPETPRPARALSTRSPGTTWPSRQCAGPSNAMSRTDPPGTSASTPHPSDDGRESQGARSCA